MQLSNYYIDTTVVFGNAGIVHHYWLILVHYSKYNATNYKDLQEGLNPTDFANKLREES